MKKAMIIILAVIVALVGAGAVYYFFFMKNLSGKIVIPYIAHQKPRIDPHVPAADPMSDKLDEVLFDGLFNVSANKSGIIYEDGLGEYLGIDQNNVVTVRLKPSKKWHSSFAVTMDKKKIAVAEKQDVLFSAKDLQFTLSRIQQLGSLSPDYVLVGQAVADFSFTGPDEANVIKFQFKGDRIWSETDVKEVLSFKILPATSDMAAPEYKDGTGPYLYAGQYEDNIYFPKNPAGNTIIPSMDLKPFIDNSTYMTELRNRNINTLLATPFGAVSEILRDSTKFFYKSNISTCFFALFHNTARLNLQQRQTLRSIMNSKEIMKRFYKIGTPQQRHICDYKGNKDNYDDYTNFSIFPGSSYYVEEEVVTPMPDTNRLDVSVLPDTVRVQACLNYGYREELSALIEILNDPTMFGGRIKATAVQNEELAAGNYDAVLVPVSGYRSNFMFDMYDIFLREPDLASHKISLVTTVGADGKTAVDPKSFEAGKNFFRLDLTQNSPEQEMTNTLLTYVYNFMSTKEIGDKQAYALRIDSLEQMMALSSWMFSLPSLAYFSMQFDPNTIDLYGVASQLSTIEKWQEAVKKKQGLF